MKILIIFIRILPFRRVGVFITQSTLVLESELYDNLDLPIYDLNNFVQAV